MIVRVFESKKALGAAAATQAAAAVAEAIRQRGVARIVAATGASQFEFLEALTGLPGIEWSKVALFQLDEYIGLPMTHPASFSRYIRERLVSKTSIAPYHALNGADEPARVVREASQAIRSAPIDVAFVGIGENAHLAFNDPPANFETEEPYVVVKLDEACRRQQVGEGWFADFSAVPTQAISMSVKQILHAREIICVVPDARKAKAVRAALEGEVSPMVPASVLKTHPNTAMFLDSASAALLSPATLSALAASA